MKLGRIVLCVVIKTSPNMAGFPAWARGIGQKTRSDEGKEGCCGRWGRRERADLTRQGCRGSTTGQGPHQTYYVDHFPNFVFVSRPHLLLTSPTSPLVLSVASIAQSFTGNRHISTLCAPSQPPRAGAAASSKSVGLVWGPTGTHPHPSAEFSTASGTLHLAPCTSTSTQLGPAPRSSRQGTTATIPTQHHLKTTTTRPQYPFPSNSPIVRLIFSLADDYTPAFCTALPIAPPWYATTPPTRHPLWRIRMLNIARSSSNVSRCSFCNHHRLKMTRRYVYFPCMTRRAYMYILIPAPRSRSGIFPRQARSLLRTKTISLGMYAPYPLDHVLLPTNHSTGWISTSRYVCAASRAVP